jgi:simple sugar transport system permease protein
MERTTEVPRELTQVLQAIVIVFLAARLRFPDRWFGKRRQRQRAPEAQETQENEETQENPEIQESRAG